ncbi:MAG TPA: hypothetical protein VE954_17010 [Oligoflexus sp.]|uniref:hypothetical protein n=1 Tax=Oligoflexus sp. TaxID=1971216 RepID=UPI002D236394|nr:hypothetical protein [Oligoflexus sp.]HYX34799.1 hypothetical protein [Oligoflexus sp.]
MFEPFGYTDIFFSILEIVCLIGLLSLFFAERNSYGRDSIGREPWTRILLYDFLTGFAYSIYWRLKVTYALHSRDRLSRLEWILLLGALFILNESLPSVFLVMTVWDFVIRSKIHNRTRMQGDWFWTFLCGHLYLASLVERSVGLLPADFRMQRADRRRKFIKIYSFKAAIALMIVALSYISLVQWRQKEFAKLPYESVDRSGYWHEVSEQYETIYSMDKNGHKEVHSLIRHKANGSSNEWIRHDVDTKIHNGLLHSWNWFSCVSTNQVIEMKPGLLVFKNNEDKTVIENRLKIETFDDIKRDFLVHDSDEAGWELGQLLKSPWGCELGFVKQSWQNAVDFATDWIPQFSF